MTGVFTDHGYVIYFDESCPDFRADDFDGNKFFINCQISFLKELLKTRGYLTLHEIVSSITSRCDAGECGIGWIHNSKITNGLKVECEKKLGNRIMITLNPYDVLIEPFAGKISYSDLKRLSEGFKNLTNELKFMSKSFIDEHERFTNEIKNLRELLDKQIETSDEREGL